MKVDTIAWGSFEITEDQITVFEQGLPGFETLRKFTIIPINDELPFLIMQSLEQREISFLVAEPFLFYPDYEWDLPEAVQQELQIKGESDVAVFAIITTSHEAAASTINLLAPIVLNRSGRLGKQHILHDSQYTSRHPLLRLSAEPGLAE
ncbi:flagellar assembly protein FliW [Paenibacillaceae bacterium]|nr:flagellar assembly protein FliW [Paenibacillaceae bacterium]